MTRRGASCNLLLIVGLAIAMATSSMAHRFADAPMDPDLRAYLEIAGTLETLCGPGTEEGGGSSTECEACLLSDTMVCTAIAPVVHRLSARIETQRRVALLRHHAKPRDPTQRTRAPPQA